MALPLPEEYPIYVGYPPVQAEYPCITYNLDNTNEIGDLRGSQVYAFTAWARTREDLNRASLAVQRIANYTDDSIKDVYIESSSSGYTDGLYYKTTYVRVVLEGSRR